VSRAMLGALILLLSVAGCTRWEPYRLPAPAVGTLPTLLRVWSPAGSRIVLTKPFLRSDSLFGRHAGDTIVVPVTTIERVERPRIDALRTAGTVVGGLAVWLTVGILGGGLE
jgi:hypothetical protein